MRLLSLLCLLVCAAPASAGSACGQPVTPISRVQGAGDTSPLDGQRVTVEGIVTLDSRGKEGFQGVYLQQADAETDQDPRTSEALFVYTRSAVGTVGHRLRVSGQVTEYHGLTELTHTGELHDCGKADLPAVRQISLPWPAGQEPEHLEAMRVSLARPLTVVDNSRLARYGSLTLASHDLYVRTQQRPPAPTAHDPDTATLELDDGKRTVGPTPLPYPAGGPGGPRTVRAGDQVITPDAILDWRYGNWHLQPRQAPVFSTLNPRKPAPDRPGAANVRVAALNLENLFNGDGQGSGFPTARGARTASAFARQKARLIATLSALRADILVLVELENDGYGNRSSLAEMTRALGQSWRFVQPDGGDGHDAIRVAMVYNQTTVQPVGRPQRLTNAPFARGSRPPLAQAFRTVTGSEAVRVVAAHFKSKRCHGARGGNRDRGDGQGCYVAARVEAARQLAAWTRTLPGVPALAGTLITGDLNSYARETPLSELARAGFTDLVRHFHGLDHHSFRFHGRAGTLDYGLASPDLLPRVKDARLWAVNSDEPSALGYGSYRRPVTASPAFPWRSSDHDPVIIDLALSRLR